MLNITRVSRNESGQVEFSLVIPPYMIPMIVQAGLTYLVGIGAVQFTDMTKEEFENLPEEERNKSAMTEEDKKLWEGFMTPPTEPVDPTKLN